MPKQVHTASFLLFRLAEQDAGQRLPRIVLLVRKISTNEMEMLDPTEFLKRVIWNAPKM